MINKTLLFLIVLFSSCVSNKDKLTKEQTAVAYVCPDGGDCNIVIEKHKSLEIKTYENGAIGYVLVDNNNKTVVQFKYTKNLDQAEVDGAYVEEVVFEIDSESKEIAYRDKALQETKMLFGRYCNCRGKAGLYRVMNGNLQLTSKKNNLTFNLDFSVPEIPQIIKTIAVKDNQLY